MKVAGYFCDISRWWVAISIRWREAALLFYTIPTRLTPPSWTLIPLVPGQDFPIRAADSLAVLTRFIEPCGALAARFFDDDLV
jgi:hypothetical protein